MCKLVSVHVHGGRGSATPGASACGHMKGGGLHSPLARLPLGVGSIVEERVGLQNRSQDHRPRDGQAERDDDRVAAYARKVDLVHVVLVLQVCGASLVARDALVRGDIRQVLAPPQSIRG